MIGENRTNHLSVIWFDGMENQKLAALACKSNYTQVVCNVARVEVFSLCWYVLNICGNMVIFTNKIFNDKQ